MNRTIKLSLITFILAGGGNLALADTIPSTAINSLAYAKDTISNGKTITSTTYSKPTDITHTGGNIKLGKINETHFISNLNITTSDTNNRLEINGDVYLQNMNISKVNQNGNTNFGILIDNNKKTSSLTMIGGSLTNVALDLWTAGYNDSIILDGVKIENIKYAHKTPQSGNLIVSNSTIKDSSFNKETTFVNSKLLGNISGNIVVDNSIVEATLNTNTLEVINGTTISSDISKVNNFILDNSTLTTDLNAKNITIKNDAKYNNKNITASGTLTIENHQIINNDKDKITLKSNGISTYKDSVIKNAVLDSNLNRIDFYNTNELDNVKISNDNAWDVTKHHITIRNNTKVTINDSEIINSAINQSASADFDSEVIINNTKLVDTGIGALNKNDLYTRIPKLELNNVNYINNVENSGIFAKEITINGGYIKANKLYGTDTFIVPGVNDISTQDNTKVIIKGGAIIEALVDGEELEIYNSKLTGDSLITNIKTDNSELIGKIEATNNIDISNSSIKGDIKGSELKLLNSDLNSNLIDIANNVIIENTEAKTITGNFKVGNDFKSSNTIIQGSINTTNNMELNNSNIKGDITANNLTLNNSSITNKADGSTNTINVTNDLTINNESQTTITGNFQVGNDFKSSNTIFSGDITANKLLSDNKSTFQGNVSADSINAVGSIFKQTLTITGNSKNNVLDKAKLEQGIIIDSKDAKVSVINGSEIKGEIKNEGFINVEKGSTVSEKVTGSGILKTDGAFYEDNVSIGKIEGENNTFKGDVTVTNAVDVYADNNTFHKNLEVTNGKLIATTKNDFKDINANNIDFINDDIKTTDEIKAQTIKVDDKLVIKNIDLKTTSISANKGEITNSNVFLNNTNEGSKDTKVFLKGKDDNASSVYDKAEITSGDYTIEKSAIKGGIRANTLTTTNSKIVGQLAVNNLNATNSTFYITGGGYNTSLYNHFSGAIIARYGASGFNNIINISNTNLGLLINGYVPIAIINNTNNSNTTNSNSTRADAIATTPKVVNKDFFKITYTTPISSVLLSPNLVHYTTMQDENGTKEVWSVGLAGKELSKDEIQAIIDGKGNVNYTTTELINKNYKDYFMSELLDDNTKAELKSIINTPYYVAKNQAEILNDRFTYLRDDIKNHGFWVNNSYNYLKTNYNDLRNKGTSVGIDKNISLDRFNLTYGVFANISRLEINKALSSSTNVRSFGAYASTNFYNGSFIDYSLAYVTLKNKFEAKKIDLYTTNYLDLYQIGLGLGHRFSINNNYLEPNIKLIATRYKDLDLKGTNASIETKKGLQASIKAGVKAGVEFNKNFSLVTELQYFKDLNALSKSKVVALLENNFNNIQDSGLNAKIGFLVKPNSNLDINADFTKNISNEFDTGYRLNLGFSYKF